MKPISFYLFGFLFLSILLPVSAQLDTFDLSKYKLPDIKRRQLDVNLSAAFTQQRDNSAELKNFSGNGSFSPRLSTYTNTSKYQGSGIFSLSINPFFAGWSTLGAPNLTESKSSSFSGDISYSSTNRFFFVNKLFIETDLSGSFYNSTTNSESTMNDAGGNFNSRTKQDQASLQAYVDASLIFGKGRIEPVEDARLAVYILQDLQKLNKLTRIPSQDEILEFSSLISTLKNKRFFDARLHKIEELTEIDHFLHEKGLVKDNDIAYFNAVNDNWDYSSGPLRSTGSKFYAGINPFLSLFTNLSHTTDFDSLQVQIGYLKTQTSNPSIQLGYLAGYEYNKPIKLCWQLKFGAVISFYSEYLTNTDIVNSVTTRNHNTYVNPREFASIGYYPNSRTFYTAGINLNQTFIVIHSWYSNINEWQKTSQMNNYTASLAFNFYYYISPQIRLNGSWNLDSGLKSDKMTSQNRNNFNQRINAGLIYSIF